MLSSLLNKNKQDIWDQITLSQLVTAIVALGDRINELDKESWRLTKKTQSNTSVWNQLITSLVLDLSESTRRSLYNIWYKNRHNIRDLVASKVSVTADDTDSHVDDEYALSETSRVSTKKQLMLKTMTSSPIRLRPKRNINENKRKATIMNETSLVLTNAEWKEIFSRTDQKMKPDWTKMFAEKIKTSGFACTPRFKTPIFKRGERKKNCRFFCCHAACINNTCPRTFHIILPREPDVGTSLLFLLRTYGEEKHDPTIETTARPLTGQERLLVGEKVNEIGPTTFFQQRIKNADQRLLAAGNLTGCETIETLKKAAADYRKKMAVDENMFTACRIYRRAYRKWDKNAKKVPGNSKYARQRTNTFDMFLIHFKGFIQMSSEWPFRLHLYTEQQIMRYIKYCSRTKYPLVHIDATGGVLKQMTEQNRSYVYAVVFKDGDDTINTIPLAHGLLTEHTTMGIHIFLGNVAQSIVKVKGHLVHPAFFITDFSPAIMNATLLAFNSESMQAHLHRCWNVIQKKYDTAQLKSLCFLHLCCSHVMNAVAKNLVDANIEKTIRESVLYLFALILCEREMEEMYNLLGSFVSIFGDPSNENAEKDLELLLLQELDVDEESRSALTNNEQIFSKAKELDNELNEADDYFHSNVAIIHQSPFNREAIRRYPSIETILNPKSTFPNTRNPHFSRKLMRLIYKWWAYLPLWTSLLVEFKERHAKDVKLKSISLHNPIRFSNALIESYFKTMKRVTLKGKRYERPDMIIENLLDVIEQQLKASEFAVTHSSKGRKRKKRHLNDEEERWNKKTTTTGKRRSKYFSLIDKIKSKQHQTISSKTDAKKSVEQQNQSDEHSTSSSEPSSSSKQSAYRIALNHSLTDNESDSISPSIQNSSTRSSESFERNSSTSGKSNWASNVPSDRSSDHNLPTMLTSSSSEESTASPVKKATTLKRSAKVLQCPPEASHPEVVIDGCNLRWPKFQIRNSMFENQSYSIANTCNIDCGLFVLYYLYRTDVRKAIDEAPQGSSYAHLRKTFQYVDTDGWDSGRIFWLLTNNILAPTDRMVKNIFGSLDENVFRSIKSTQRYTRVAMCERANCSSRQRILINTELCIQAGDEFIDGFEVESTGKCTAIINQHDKVAPTDGTNKTTQDNVPVFDVELNKIEDASLCGAVTVTSCARFDNDSPPLIIVDILTAESRNTTARYNPHNVRLTDIKPILRIGAVKYTLRAVIHHRSGHFIATIIGKNKALYLYDDMSGVVQVQRSMDIVETGIFTRMD